MDRTAGYNLCFAFPFNAITSGLYSDDEIWKKANLDQVIRTIELIIASHGFISMETIMKYMEMRPTRHCPGIYFTALEDWEIGYDEVNQTDVVTLYLSNIMKLRPVLREEGGRYRRRAEPIRDIPDLNSIRKPKEEETWQEDTQKETSGSEENGKTSSDSSGKN